MSGLISWGPPSSTRFSVAPHARQDEPTARRTTSPTLGGEAATATSAPSLRAKP